MDFVNTYILNSLGYNPTPDLFKVFYDNFRTVMLEHLLKTTNGNQIKCAKIIGITRDTLRKELKEYKIDYKKYRVKQDDI